MSSGRRSPTARFPREPIELWSRLRKPGHITQSRRDAALYASGAARRNEALRRQRITAWSDQGSGPSGPCRSRSSYTRHRLCSYIERRISHEQKQSTRHSMECGSGVQRQRRHIPGIKGTYGHASAARKQAYPDAVCAGRPDALGFDIMARHAVKKGELFKERSDCK